MAHIRHRPGRPKPWQARWRELDGAERSESFRRKGDARNHLTGVESDKLDGSYIDPRKGRTPVADYYAMWAKRQPWRESSRASVEWIFNDHVLPTFGGRALASIRRGDIESWGAGLSLGGQTARLAMSKLSGMLEGAAADGYIPRNPARKAKRPRADGARVVPFTSDELDALRDAAPEWFKVSLTLGSAVGLRHGEATGLTADRIDFLGRTLTVDRQLTPGSHGPHPAFAPPKTKPSYRTIPLADVALESLARHIEHHEPGPDGLVLHEDGRPVHRQRFGHLWRKTRERAGVRDDARFHDTRHTYAAIMLSGGVSVAAVAEYMGHSPATLLKVYAHLIPADHDRARDVVQAAFTREAIEAKAATRCADGATAK